jgi:hypothetical protein
LYGSQVTRALWNCLFLYFASGSDSPDHYLIELPLPSPVLHTSLLSLGAQQDPNSGEYKVTRSAIWQLYHYAHALTDPLPFPHVPTTSPPSSIAPTTSPNEHPLRPMKPFAGSTIYSRHVPHLDSFFKLSVCGKDDLPTLHGWLNDARVDKWWGDAGTMEAHEKFLEERRVDAHVIPVIGSYVTVGSGGNSVETCEEATYSEVYWVKEDRLAELVPAQVQDYDRGESKSLFSPSSFPLSSLSTVLASYETNGASSQVSTCSWVPTPTEVPTASEPGSLRSYTTASSTTRGPSESSPSPTSSTPRCSPSILSLSPLSPRIELIQFPVAVPRIGRLRPSWLRRLPAQDECAHDL